MTKCNSTDCVVSVTAFYIMTPYCTYNVLLLKIKKLKIKLISYDFINFKQQLHLTKKRRNESLVGTAGYLSECYFLNEKRITNK